MQLIDTDGAFVPQCAVRIHPGILPAHRRGTAQNRFFYTETSIEGSSCEEVISRNAQKSANMLALSSLYKLCGF